MGIDVNHILRIYLGATAVGGYQPVGCEERLKDAYSADYERLLEVIGKYLNEEHESNGSEHDVGQEADLFADALRKRYPELDQTIVKALVNRWCYSQR